jgi:hypothetical protein
MRLAELSIANVSASASGLLQHSVALSSVNDRQRAASSLMSRVPQPKFRPDARKRDQRRT